MIGKPGPFKVIEVKGSGDVAEPVYAPRRRFSCENYETCLQLAAALNWDNFTCSGCNGEIDQTLCWRAHQIIKTDKVARGICSEIPVARSFENGTLTQAAASADGPTISQPAACNPKIKIVRR